MTYDEFLDATREQRTALARLFVGERTGPTFDAWISRCVVHDDRTITVMVHGGNMILIHTDGMAIIGKE